MFPPLQKTRMLCPTPGERAHTGVVQTLLYCLAVFGLSSVGRVVAATVIDAVAPDTGMIARNLTDLFMTAGGVAAVILWVRFFERRALVTLGFVRRRAVGDYLAGLVLGVLLFGCAVGLCVLGGVAEVRVTAPAPSWGLPALFFVGFLIQGLSEELLCRSLLMVSLSRRWPLWACAVANAGAFALLHLPNPGVTLVALVNIFLFGLFASLLTLRLGSIWMVAAIHSLWNFAQGNLFGIPVSGITGMPAPLTTTLATDTPRHTLLSGGTFGIEGGLAATVVLVVAIAAVIILPTRRDEVADES